MSDQSLSSAATEVTREAPGQAPSQVRRASQSPSILIVAGDSSGDCHGALLANELVNLAPEVLLLGVGGPRMAAAGVVRLLDSSHWGLVGFYHVLPAIPRMLGFLHALQRYIGESPPTLLIAIDFGGFNTRLLGQARRLGIPSLYYFPPRSWDRRTAHGRKMVSLGCAAATPYPWSAELLRKHGLRAEWVGHPVLEVVGRPVKPEGFRREFGLGQRGPLVGLFPGSRRQELDRILPTMLRAVELIHRERPEVLFAMAPAASLPLSSIKRSLRHSRAFVTLVPGRQHDLLNAAQLSVVASGSITLEAACLGAPMVIVYDVPLLDRALFKLLIRQRRIGLPNILLEREVAPELTGGNYRPETVAATVLGLLSNSVRLSQMRSQLLSVRRLLGDGRASRRVAEMALAMLREPRAPTVPFSHQAKAE